METSITLIYPFRNRDSIRVKNSLESLKLQSNPDFKVIFIDFGSKQQVANEVKNVVEQFSFATYYYTYHIHQPWNKSKAINIALDKIDTTHCFVSDVDMVYHPNFITTLKEQSKLADVNYFQVGYLPHNTIINLKDYDGIKAYRISNEDATGLTLFNTKQLLSINGFDEYYHFWSSEDTDAHVRMLNKGYSLSFYDQQLLIKHQPHSTYRSRETKQLTQELRLTNVVRLNQKRMLVNKKAQVSYVTQKRAKLILEQDFLELQNPVIEIKITNYQAEVYYYVLEELKRLKGKKIKLIIEENSDQNTLKNIVKKILRKSFQPIISMKEVNDLLLQQLIFNYHSYNYSLIISEDLKRIEFSIDLR